MFLTPAQVHELTGYQRPSKQIAWLRANGLRFFVAADGHPRVPSAQFEQPAGATQRSTPNLDALRREV